MDNHWDVGQDVCALANPFAFGHGHSAELHSSSGQMRARTADSARVQLSSIHRIPGIPDAGDDSQGIHHGNQSLSTHVPVPAANNDSSRRWARTTSERTLYAVWRHRHRCGKHVPVAWNIAS